MTRKCVVALSVKDTLVVLDAVRGALQQPPWGRAIWWATTKALFAAGQEGAKDRNHDARRTQAYRAHGRDHFGF